MTKKAKPETNPDPLQKHEARIRAILESKQLSTSVSLLLIQITLSLQGEEISLPKIKKFVKKLGYK